MGPQSGLRIVPVPLTPATPVDYLAALALSSGKWLGDSRAVPKITLTLPSSPDQNSASFSPAVYAPKEYVPSLTDSILSIGQLQPGTIYPRPRPLAPNEVRQIVLLLEQHFKPFQHDSKGLMHASIDLAEQLHEAGIRRGRRGRVMGVHLRGIWETAEEGVLIHLRQWSLLEAGIVEALMSVNPEPSGHEQTPLPIPTEMSSQTHLRRCSLQLEVASATASPLHDRGTPSDLDLPHVFQSVNDLSRGPPSVLKRRSAMRGARSPHLTVQVHHRQIGHQACRSASLRSARPGSAGPKSAQGAEPMSTASRGKRGRKGWMFWKRQVRATARHISVGGWEVR